MDNLVTILVFLALGAFFVFFSGVLRPRVKREEKSSADECGEPAMGTSCVQFDWRFYMIALLFLVFDVVVALFYPWAVVFNRFKLAALLDMAGFFAVLMVGYAYLCRFGYLDWLRPDAPPATRQVSAAASAALPQHVRKDPELADGDRS